MSNSEQNIFRIIGCAWAQANARMPAFERTDYEVCTIEYIASGRGFLEEDGHRWELGKEDIYILRKHGNHRYYQDRNDPWLKLFFVADGKLMEDIFRELLEPKDYVFHNCSGLKHYFEAILNLYSAGSETGNDREAALLFHHLIYDLSKMKYRTHPEKITPESELKKALENTISLPFSLQQYAEQKQYTKSYLIRRFRTAYGKTPYDHLLDMRIQKAGELLRYTTLTIKEIADQLAFPDQASFTHCFRARTGCAPKRYRQLPGLDQSGSSAEK